MRFIIDTARLLLGSLAFGVMFFVGIPLVVGFMAILGIAVAWAEAWDRAKAIVPARIPVEARVLAILVVLANVVVIVRMLLAEHRQPGPSSGIWCLSGNDQACWKSADECAASSGPIVTDSCVFWPDREISRDAKIHCTGGAHAIVVDGRVVGCQR